MMHRLLYDQVLYALQGPSRDELGAGELASTSAHTQTTCLVLAQSPNEHKAVVLGDELRT